MTGTQSASKNDELRGACLCGIVQFRTTPMREAHICHCEKCRRHCGAAFHAVPCADFTVDSGRSAVIEYATSKWATRGFCRHCGSSLYFRTHDHAYYGASIGCLIGEKPDISRHIYVDSADVGGDYAPDIWDDLPRYTQQEYLRYIGLDHLADKITAEDLATGDVEASEHYGGCSCGSVRFRTTGALRKLLICHCTQCQQQSSGYYRTTAVDKDDFVLEKNDGLVWYASSDLAERAFCHHCGSKLFWRGMKTVRENIDIKHTISILAGAFDTRLPLETEKHIFAHHPVCLTPECVVPHP